MVSSNKLKPGDLISICSKTALGKVDSIFAIDRNSSIHNKIKIEAGSIVMVLETGLRFRPTGIPLIKLLYKEQAVYVVPNQWFAWEFAVS